jgi:hypothetical protein
MISELILKRSLNHSVQIIIHGVYKKKLNRFEIALNFAKQLLVFDIDNFFGYL